MPKALTIEQKKERAETKVAERASEKPNRRKKNATFGGLNKKLDVDKQIEGYHLHWLNDTPGRIAGALESGYEHVKEKEVFSYTDSEEFVKRHVGATDTGTSMVAYLMKIRQDWYEEDQADIQAQNDKFESAIRQGKLDAPTNSYGGANIVTNNKF